VTSFLSGHPSAPRKHSLPRPNAALRLAVAVPTSAVVCLLLLAAAPSAARADDAFEKNIRPILVQHCQGCHGPEKQKAGLRLDSKAGWQTGGENGPAIVPGKPDRSLLIKAVRGAEGLERMPPTGSLSPREIAALTKWVKDGALDPRDGGPVRKCILKKCKIAVAFPKCHGILQPLICGNRGDSG
jgi:mono/diheme cytochrome c family protein